MSVLEPWRAAGKVSLFDAPGRGVQLAAYRHCLRESARDSVWMMFVDVDEFLFAPAQPDLRLFLQAYENEAGVIANWIMFGASGHQRRPSGLTTLNFTRRCDLNLRTMEPLLFKGGDLDPRDPTSYYRICAHLKSIVNTRDVSDTGLSVHDFRYRDGRMPVNANHRRVLGPFCDDLSAIPLLRINHYVSRSWEEFHAKLIRGRGDITGGYDAQAQVQRNLLFDQVEDHEIFPLARQVESNIREQKPI
jgi:hypothetical protein